MAKTIVILGGSYAGVHIAHYLLKQKIPDVKVILVSKVSERNTSTLMIKANVGQDMSLTPYAPRY